jgi:hypothetical protein
MLDAVFTGSWSQQTSSSASINVDLKTFALKELGTLGGATVGLELDTPYLFLPSNCQQENDKIYDTVLIIVVPFICLS